MDRRIAQGPVPSGPPHAPAPGEGDEPASPTATVLVGLGIVAAVLLVYVFSNPQRPNLYNHFVWQAAAWLQGQGTIPYPAPANGGLPGNGYFQDVLPVVDATGVPTGRAILPFPPLPAVLLLPFVAVWGLATDAQLVASVVGGLDVGIVFWMLGRLGGPLAIRVAVTLFFALGTVFWYAAEKGTTWFLAHIVAVGLTCLAVGVALGADRAAALGALRRGGEDDPPAGDGYDDEEMNEGEIDEGDEVGWDEGQGYGWGHGWRHGWRTLLEPSGFLAGLLLGLASTARLTVILGLPFFLLVGAGGGWLRRGASVAVGAAVPLACLVAYNVVSTGHLFNPAYDYLHRAEIASYPFLDYRPDWAIEDPRYLPRNLVLMLVGPPLLTPDSVDLGQVLCAAPGATRGWFDPDCPILMPNTVGMGLLFTSPAYLLALPALRRYGRSRLVTGSALGVLLIALVNLMHFSQGWVQFGYRFSLDFAPFLLLLTAAGMQRMGGVRPLAVVLIGASVVVTVWGVWWGTHLGW